MSDTKANIHNKKNTIPNNRVGNRRRNFYPAKKRIRTKQLMNSHGTLRGSSFVNTTSLLRSKSASNLVQQSSSPTTTNDRFRPQPNHRLSNIYSRPQFYHQHMHPSNYIKHPRNSKKTPNNTTSTDIKNQKPSTKPLKQQSMRNRKPSNKSKNTSSVKNKLSNISEISVMDDKNEEQKHSPKNMNIMLPMNSAALQGLEAGTHIKITTKQGESIEGEVFCSIPQIPPICVMHRYNAHPRGTKNIYVISINEIECCVKYESVNDRRNLELCKIDEKQMQERIERNMAERGRKMRTLNTNVPSEIQQLFDYLSRSSSVILEWNDTSIVNIEYGLAIHPPYKCIIGNDGCTHYSWIDKQLKQFWENRNVNDESTTVQPNNQQQQMFMHRMNVQQIQQQIHTPVLNSHIMQFQGKSNGLQTNQNINRGGRGHSRGRGRGYNDKPHVPPRHQFYGQYRTHSRGRMKGRGGRGRNRGGKGRMFNGKNGRNNNSRVVSNSNGKGMNATQVQSNLQTRSGEHFNQ